MPPAVYGGVETQSAYFLRMFFTAKYAPAGSTFPPSCSHGFPSRSPFPPFEKNMSVTTNAAVVEIDLDHSRTKVSGASRDGSVAAGSIPSMPVQRLLGFGFDMFHDQDHSEPSRNVFTKTFQLMYSMLPSAGTLPPTPRQQLPEERNPHV